MPNTREKLIELLETVANPLDITIYGEVCVTTSQVADHLIANGVTVQEWISVKDRLPDEDGYYLCNVRSFAFRGSFYAAMLKYDNGGFIEGHIYTDDVTHWMPIPMPPKGE